MKKFFRSVFEVFIILIGSFIAGLSLEFFLVPNQILDGGVVGVSIILTHLTGIKLSVLLVLLNIPFFFLSYKQLGKSAFFKFLFGVIGLSLSTHIFHHVEPFTDDLLLATVFGGLILGAGIGIAMKAGGALDGSEVFSLFINAKTGKSVSQVLLAINVVIFSIAGFVFGWEQAMYSILSFYIAFKMIDIVLEGLDETKNFWIISEHHEEISARIMKELGRGVTYFNGEGAYTNEDKKIIFCVVTRLEESLLKNIVHDLDPEAFVAIGHIAEVRGRHF